MAADTAPPVGRLRGAANPSPGTVAPWTAFTQQAREHVPELRWPRRNVTFGKMLDTDSQVWGLYAGFVQPIEAYGWWVDPNGNDLARTAPLAEDLGLPIGEPSEREDERERTSLPGEFDFGDVLHDALWAPAFGHHYFEWAFAERDGLYRLDEVAPLHPSTLSNVVANRRGHLEYVTQKGVPGDSPGGRANFGTPGYVHPQRINEPNLIPFVFWPDAERRWLGRSLLRPVYRNWLCKDVLLRVDLTNHGRAGGVPVVRTDERYQGVSLADLQRLASEFRVDEEAGAAMPPGAWIELLMGGKGDRIASIRYHDEQMSKVFGTMVRELGQTATGSRALGQTFGDLESLARHSLAEWARKTFNRWVLARWWWWNYGERNPPVLRYTAPELEGAGVTNEPPGPAAPEGVPDPEAEPVTAALPASYTRRFGCSA